MRTRFLPVVERGELMYKYYGGKIFAVGVVTKAAEYIEDDLWKTKIYAGIDHITLLPRPIDISEFNSFIMVSRTGANTNLFGEEFDKLVQLIAQYNQLPDYILQARSIKIPLSQMDDSNWVEITAQYRGRFLSKGQYQTFFIKRLLGELVDRKKNGAKEKIFDNCQAVKAGKVCAGTDHIFKFKDKYLIVMDRISILTDKEEIREQCIRLCDTDYYELSKDTDKHAAPVECYNKYILVIDIKALYLYNAVTLKLDKIYDLSDFRTLEDVEKIREQLASKLMHYENAVVEPYEGDEPYIFISYAHADRAEVNALIAYLGNRYRIWFDKGIHGGTDWTDTIARHVKNATVVLPCFSPQYMESENCKKEFLYATSLKHKKVLAVYFKPTELSDGIEMYMAGVQTVQKFSIPSEAEFYAKIDGAEVLQQCRIR